MKNNKTIVAYFVEYTVEKFEKFLITFYLIKQLLTFNFSRLITIRTWSMID